MNNKIALVYENGEFSVNINGTLMNKGNNAEEMFAEFQRVIKNNAIRETTSWGYITSKVKELDLSKIEINEAFKTIQYENMKYFHNTNKLFNISEENMAELAGGYNLFYFVLEMIKDGYIETSKDILDICVMALDNKSNYRWHDTSFIVASAAFNYGVAEYNFATGKINRGVAIEKAAFSEFKKYVCETFDK